MSDSTPGPATRSRWLDWTPVARISDGPPDMAPTKPSKPGSVGFEGSYLGESPKIAVPESSDLAAILRGKAIELWLEAAGGRLFIVADERDVVLLNQRRGEVLTADELRLVVKITDPVDAAEVLRWKREFDGSLTEGGNTKVSLRLPRRLEGSTRP